MSPDRTLTPEQMEGGPPELIWAFCWFVLHLMEPEFQILPFLQLVHVQEAVAILPGQLELGRQRKHGLVEVPEHGFDRGGVLVAVVDVVVQTDELPVDAKKIKKKKRCFRTNEGEQ